MYVKVAFSPQAKERMQTLVKNLGDSLKVHLEGLEWMSDETKKQAMEKWASFTPKVGYPDKWSDWSGPETGRDSFFGNVMDDNEFNYKCNLGKIGEPVDNTEWGMSPQPPNT